MDAIFRTRTADEWFALLNQTDVCAAPVLAPAEAAANPHNLAREMILDLPRPDGSGEVGVEQAVAEVADIRRIKGRDFRLWRQTTRRSSDGGETWTE